MVKHGIAVTSQEIAGTDHFEYGERLDDENYILTQVRKSHDISQ